MNDSRKTVRRKEDDLTHLLKSFDAHVKEDVKNFESILKELKEFREEMNPVREAFNGVRWSGWAMAKIVGFIGAILGIGLGVKELFKK